MTNRCMTACEVLLPLLFCVPVLGQQILDARKLVETLPTMQELLSPDERTPPAIMADETPEAPMMTVSLSRQRTIESELGGAFDLELLVRNRSKDSIMFPATRDWRVMRSASKADKIEVVISAALQTEGLLKTFLVGLVLHGSRAIRSSVIVMPPESTLTIIVPMRVRFADLVYEARLKSLGSMELIGPVQLTFSAGAPSRFTYLLVTEEKLRINVKDRNRPKPEPAKPNPEARRNLHVRRETAR